MVRTLTTKSGISTPSWVARGIAALIVLVAAISFIVFPPSDTVAFGLTSGKRRVLAIAEAKHLLTLPPLPNGSKRIPTWIAADGRALANPAYEPNGPKRVDVTYYYLVPGGSRAFNALEQKAPSGGRLSGIGTLSGSGRFNVRFMWFSFRSTSYFSNPELEYSTQITPQGELELRVDAFV
jgi:hypothetical protein